MKYPKLIAILVLLILFKSSYGQLAVDKPLAAVFDSLISMQYQHDQTGATVLVSKGGEIIYEKAFGLANLELNVPMNVDNVFRIGSITKQFTAIAILQLMEEGILNLQDSITKFIPDYPTRGNKITIEHLLTHTSGIANYSGIADSSNVTRGDLTPKEMIDFFKNLPMRFVTGTKWEYSNSNYFLLGYIIEVVTGKSYAQYLEDHFFKPLGMTHSMYGNDIQLVKNRAGAYSQGENGYENSLSLKMSHVYSAGAIQSTVGDLFKWHQALHTYKLVKKETLEKAHSKYQLTDGKQTAYGYGWRLGYMYDSPTIFHGGQINGFSTMEMYLPKEDVFVAIFSNCDCNSPAEIATRVAALATGKPLTYIEIPIDKTILNEYIGVYKNSKGQQRIITVADQNLFSQIGRGPKSNLKAYQKNKYFFANDPMQSIEFVRNKANEIEKLISMSLNGNEDWIKTSNTIPGSNGIKLNKEILELYVGKYEVTPDFVFSVSLENGKLFLQAPEQERLEMFADTENIFFLRVNDAQIEFVKNNLGKVSFAILNQGGRQAEAKKIE